MSEIKIVDGTKHLDEVKNLIETYTKFLGRDLTFQNLDAEFSDLAKKYCPPEGLYFAQQSTIKLSAV